MTDNPHTCELSKGRYHFADPGDVLVYERRLHEMKCRYLAQAFNADYDYARRMASLIDKKHGPQLMNYIRHLALQMRSKAA